MTPNLSKVLEQLVASEITFQLDGFTCGYLGVKLGDPANGFVASTSVRAPDDAAAWLADAARRHFPESEFALAEPVKRKSGFVPSDSAAG